MQVGVWTGASILVEEVDILPHLGANMASLGPLLGGGSVVASWVL